MEIIEMSFHFPPLDYIHCRDELGLLMWLKTFEIREKPTTHFLEIKLATPGDHVSDYNSSRFGRVSWNSPAHV